ncbi:(2,3-dihydroxybenzoyl)adenylate synthase [Kutzneria kofuensis]|uniref:2,3-dihydroxybenzoate-AMP ligase n=1 Tax=Kutzneria kofuensis TaxID=103725 RepID=A0A7W9KQD8_9PSEU|nr:AMP-binding protein [Kutzneria kofuensis]MBB5896806.1 2,3-dihydroxybenzoate-AMP ligase [Kutzneria kofuensis]
MPERDPAPVAVAPPADLVAEYTARGWWRDELVDELVLRPSGADPDRVAILAGDQRLTRGELAARVAAAAAGFRELGVGPGDRVVVRLPNGPDLLVTVLGLVRSGALPVLAVPALGTRELRHVVTTAQARALVVSPGRDELPDLPGVTVVAHPARSGAVALADVLAADGPPPSHRADPADVAFFLLSGGTTGLPKLIPRTHRDYGYNLRMSAELAGVDENTRYLAALPVTHNFALGCPGVLGVLAAGGTAVFPSATGVPALLDAIARHRVTATATVPGMAVALCDSGADLSGLALLQVGGAKLHRADALRVVKSIGGRLQQVFGMAEGLLNFTRLDDPEDVVTGTQGRPGSPGDEVLIVGEDGQPVPDGQIGELLVRGPYTIGAYHRAPEANAASFTSNGFYRSGDLVRRDEGGNLVVEGRRREFVNRGGEKVSVNEVEGLLVGCPGVAACAVAPVPHEFLGETVGVFVVPAGDAAPDLADVRRYLRHQGLAGYKLPDLLRVLEALPLTPVGKLDRAALTALATPPGGASARTDRSHPEPQEALCPGTSTTTS